MSQRVRSVVTFSNMLLIYSNPVEKYIIISYFLHRVGKCLYIVQAGLSSTIFLVLTLGQMSLDMRHSTRLLSIYTKYS